MGDAIRRGAFKLPEPEATAAGHPPFYALPSGQLLNAEHLARLLRPDVLKRAAVSTWPPFQREAANAGECEDVNSGQQRTSDST